MKITEIIKSKKFKNTVVTLLEIVVIAGVIMAILLTVQSKLKDSSGIGISIGSSDEDSQNEVIKEKGLDEYHLEVNLKKSVLIVYQYSKDKSQKNPIKVMQASIGKDVKADKYKLQETYTWYNSEKDVWNKYNTRYTTTGWIQSVNYNDKYSWTLNQDSYNSLGKSQSEDANIKLLANDAQWIFANCGSGTVLRIKKGSKDDVLPLEVEMPAKAYKTCGWEPTDPEKGNPYKTIANATIASFDGIVMIEKGSEVDYVSNLIAMNEAGSNITNKLKYDEFNSSEMGLHEVKYSFTTKAGAKLETIVRYEVIDTTVPVVELSESTFIYEVDSEDKKDLNTKEVKEEIENLVKKSASANEGSITATTVPKEQLKVGINYVHVVAKDTAGNVGSAQAIVEIKVKEEKETDSEKKTEKTTKKKKEEETTKKKKKEEKTSKEQKEEKTESRNEEVTESAVEIHTESQTEEVAEIQTEIKTETPTETVAETQTETQTEKLSDEKTDIQTERITEIKTEEVIDEETNTAGEINTEQAMAE